MRASRFGALLRRSGVAAALLMGSAAAFAQSTSTVSLTAAPADAVLPDGQQVPMWGYVCGTTAPTPGPSCSPLNPGAGTHWSPVLITVPYEPSGTTLQINLTNSLT